MNFNIVEKFDFIDKLNLTSNDIQAMSKKFGVIIYFMHLDLSGKKCVGEINCHTLRCIWCVS